MTVQNGAAIWTRTGRVVLQDASFATGPDDQRRAVSRGRDPLLIESTAGTVVQILPDAAPAESWRRPLAFADARRVLTLEGTGALWGLGLWDVDGHKLALLPGPQPAFTDRREQSPSIRAPLARPGYAAAHVSGRTLAGGWADRNGPLAVWDTTPWGGIVSRPPALDGNRLVVSATRQQLVCGYRDGTITTQACPDGRALTRWRAHSQKIAHLEVSEGEEDALTVGDDLEVKYWRLADGHLVWEVPAEVDADAGSRWMSRRWQRTACLLAGSAGVVGACLARGVIRYSPARSNDEGDVLLSVPPRPSRWWPPVAADRGWAQPWD